MNFGKALNHLSFVGLIAILATVWFFLPVLEVWATTETLRPNGVGSETSLGNQFPDSGEHWDKVAEAVADDATYVHCGGIASNDLREHYALPGQKVRVAKLSNYLRNLFALLRQKVQAFLAPKAQANGLVYQRDLYALPAHTGSGTINSVTVYARLKYGAETDRAKISIRANDTITDTSEISLTESFTDYSNIWATNPVTLEPWTWDEIDALEAGISLASGMMSILKGQRILMADGSPKNIEDIQVGDEIVSFNLDSKKTEKDKVTQINQGTHDDYLVFNGALKTSLEHVIWASGAFKTAKDVKEGDFLFNAEGKEVEITQIAYIQEKAATYDLVIEKNHNFFVENYLVHNGAVSPACSQLYVVVDYTAAAASTGSGGRFCVGPKVFDDSLVINQGAPSTQAREVELSLRADSAVYLSVCNNNLFYGGCILEPYLGSAITHETKSWVLSEGDGEKTVYAVFVSGCGANSLTVSDTIILKTAPEQEVVLKEEARPKEEIPAAVPEEVSEEVSEEVVPEKSVTEMTLEKIRGKIVEIQQAINKVLGRLNEFLQQQTATIWRACQYFLSTFLGK